MSGLALAVLATASLLAKATQIQILADRTRLMAGESIALKPLHGAWLRPPVGMTLFSSGQTLANVKVPGRRAPGITARRLR